MQRYLKIPYFITLGLLAYMPLHIFLAQSLSLITGGLEFWKVGKDIVLGLAVLFTICLVLQQGKANRIFKLLVGVTFVYGALHVFLWLVHPELHARSAMLGIIYNVRLLLFAILGAGAALLWPKFAFSSLLKWILGVSSFVAIFGIVQYFLPSDFLSHFGYSLERGVRPAFFIDDNPDFPRIMSTLREPNALGAYLILPFTVLMVYLFKVKDVSRRYVLIGMLGLHILAIFLTFSRSAWLATVVAAALVLWWQHAQWLVHRLKRIWPILAALCLLLITIGFASKDTHFFQQYVIHSNPKETVQDLDSNDYHSLLVTQGIEGVVANPLGHGPGTAGIVSIQNPGGGQLTENYYVQIAYEVGIVGLALFVASNAVLYVLIWRRRNIYAVIICASFWGYVITNMLLHTWSNEAVAAQWWILTGVCVIWLTASNKATNRDTE